MYPPGSLHFPVLQDLWHWAFEVRSRHLEVTIGVVWTFDSITWNNPPKQCLDQQSRHMQASRWRRYSYLRNLSTSWLCYYQKQSAWNARLAFKHNKEKPGNGERCTLIRVAVPVRNKNGYQGQQFVFKEAKKSLRKKVKFLSPGRDLN